MCISECMSNSHLRFSAGGVDHFSAHVVQGHGQLPRGRS